MRIWLKCRHILVAFVALALLTASTSSPRADSTRYLDDIKSLTTPAMEGRGDGTRGLTRAEHLIEKRYKELRLEPAGVHGYAQSFSVITGARSKSDNHLKIETAGSGKELKANDDFVPFSFLLFRPGHRAGGLRRIRRHR